MKLRRGIVLAFFLALSPALLHAQADSVEILQQTLEPKEIYVGDTAQVKLTFQTSVDFFALASSECITADGISLSTNLDCFTEQEQACTTVRALLEQKDSTYILSVTFIPWQTGTIDFSTFNLNDACRIEPGKISANFIDIKPVTVTSLSEKLSVTTLRDPEPPKLLPGTNYILWAIIILALAALILIILIIVHLPDFISGGNALLQKISFIKNSSSAKYQLKLLSKKKLSDAKVAEEWQHIMRGYLEARFSVKFNSVATNNLYGFIQGKTGNLLCGEREEAAEKLYSLFLRTDFIRYAHGSLEEENAVFNPGEKKQIVEDTVKLIDQFEKPVAAEEDAR